MAIYLLTKLEVGRYKIYSFNNICTHLYLTLPVNNFNEYLYLIIIINSQIGAYIILLYNYLPKYKITVGIIIYLLLLRNRYNNVYVDVDSILLNRYI